MSPAARPVSATPGGFENDTFSLDREVKSGHSDSFSSSDLASIALLSVLYTLQGIPMGLSGSVPLILAKRVGYAEQAIFSFCSWPFSLKLLWAPLVDSWWLPQVGRRKSWLVPVQFLTAALMILGASPVDSWVGEDVGGADSPGNAGAATVNTRALTAYFFTLYFLMATQDIAVDGWALTMLSRGKVGYASTCNSVGQTLGYFIAFVGFLTLNDPNTCNKYLRTEPVEGVGLVSLSGFIRFWGYVFLVTTVYVWVFKPETLPPTPRSSSSSSAPPPSTTTAAGVSKPASVLAAPPHEKRNDDLQYGPARTSKKTLSNVESGGDRPSFEAASAGAWSNSNGGGPAQANGGGSDKGHDRFEGVEEDDSAGVAETYGHLWMVLKLPAIQSLVLVLLTCKTAFAVTDAATTLKFIEFGVPKEQMAYFAPAFVAIGIVVPVVVGRFTNGPRPLSVFLAGVPLRLASGLVLAAVLRHTKAVYAPPGPEDGDPGVKFWAMFLAASALNNIASNLMFVAQMSFFAQISDPAIGGTYMTLLNTVANLGSKWPTSLSLFLLDSMTFKQCTSKGGLGNGGGGRAENRNLLSSLFDKRGDASSAAALEALSCAASSGGEETAGSECERAGGACATTVDGYDVQLVLCTVLGVVWLVLLWRIVQHLQTIPRSKWAISA